MTRMFILLGFLISLHIVLPVRAETISYRGRTIAMPDGGNNALFEEHIRKAIDMVESLPPKYKTLGNYIKDLRYKPLPANATNTAAYENIVGTYVIESKDAVKGHIMFPRNPAFLAPANYAMSLVTNGVYYQWHSKYVEARQRMGKSPNEQAKSDLAYYEALLGKKDLNLVIKAECEIMDVTIGTMKSLGLDAKKIDATTKERNNRGC